MKSKKRKTVEFNIGIFVVAIAITVIAITMLKYQVEGEKDMPYVLKQMVLISTANGTNTSTDEYKWNINIYQNTDLYFEIARNTEYKTNENIKNVKIQNIQITPKSDYKPNIYLPTAEGTEMFNYTEENLAGQEIEYIVDKNKDAKTRKITTEGGIIALSFCIPDIGVYKGNDDKISYDGTLLSKIGITKEQISYNISFSLIIETETDKKYKADINLELPPEDITSTGIVKIENEELTDLVFKRTN